MSSSNETTANQRIDAMTDLKTDLKKDGAPLMFSGKLRRNKYYEDDYLDLGDETWASVAEKLGISDVKEQYEKTGKLPISNDVFAFSLALYKARVAQAIKENRGTTPVRLCTIRTQDDYVMIMPMDA